VEGPGADIEPPPPSPADRRRLRAAAAGLVTSVIVVTGGLMLVADDGPASGVAAPSTSVSPIAVPSSSRPSRLGTPTHLTVDRGVTTVSLAWDPPAGTDPSGIHHYEVFRDGKRVGRSTRPRFDVAGLTFGTRFRFWVVAVDQEGRASPRTLRSVTTRVPPLTAARLSGTYDVTASVTAAGGGRARFASHSITWSLVPQCPDRACDVSFTATHRFASDAVVTSGVLAWSGGATYSGTWVGSFGSACVERKLEALSTITITMRATSARVVGGLWVASGIGGSIHERVRGCGGAPTATYAF
jgi:chitodextrinase